MHFYTNFAKIMIATFVKWNKSVIKYNIVCNAYVKNKNKDNDSKQILFQIVPIELWNYLGHY